MTLKTALKISVKIFMIIWSIIGFFIIYWTGFLYYKMHTINNLGVLAIAFLFGTGIYMLAIYIPVTILLWLIYHFIIKKHEKNKTESKRSKSAIRKI